jgi:superfamily II DNA or RNA helicase
MSAYVERAPRDFLVVATPGAGKTALAMVLARRLLDDKVVQRVVVVTPTDHLKSQWAEVAQFHDVALDPTFGRGSGITSDFHGPVLTYAGVAAATGALRAFVSAHPTLVILDEVHHAGDSLSWGEAVQEAFEPAARRLLLTGTPFRSDVNPIPFVEYTPDAEGALRSRADFEYGYSDALADRAVRPVIFLAYAGQMTWRTRAGEVLSADVGAEQPKEYTAAAWRTALDPNGDWIGQVLRDADRRLSEIRREVPDAGGMVLASDQKSARAYAARLRRLTGQQAVVVLSDDPSASSRIESFAASGERWLVAVRMVSEGVDVPRLSVGVYATSTATPLYFAQAVGRFVRVRRPGETASVFLPSVPRLLAHAASLEVQRDHVLRRRDEAGLVDDQAYDWDPRAEQPAESDGEEIDGPAVLPLTSEANLDRVVYDGGVFDSQTVLPLTDEEEQFLGIPGLLTDQQMAELLRGRQQPGSAAKQRHDTPAAKASQIAELRAELSACVRAYARQCGITPAAAHAEARRLTGGPPAAQADEATLKARIEAIRDRAVGRR